MASELETLIAAKGGTVLVPPFVSESVDYVKIRCANGHEWTPRVRNLLDSGSWCPHCYGNARCSIEELHAWALELGGRCLSGEYRGNKAHYDWECGQCRNQWKATWFNVKVCGSWCPECKTSIRELIARAAFQENFPGFEFAKNRTAIGMELDGYSEAHMLAFEHDGVQHRMRVEHFQRKEGDFEAQVARDRLKDKLCDEAGITLIRVPDRGILQHSKIRAFIRDKIAELGYAIPKELPDDATFFASVRTTRGESPYQAKALEAIKKRGGDLAVEGGCPTRTYPLHVKCAQGHVFETHYDNLSRGRWCPQCGGTAPVEAGRLRAAVEERSYELLRTENRKDGKGKNRKYITVQCPDKDHPPTEILWDNFKKGRGCQKCGRKRAGATRRADSEAVTRRLSRAGLALVESYKTMNTPAIFECAGGHRFASTVKKVEDAPEEGSCPVCIIAALEHIILVDEYGPETDPVKTQLTWRCTKCQSSFQTTYRGMRIRKKLCRNPKC